MTISLFCWFHFSSFDLYFLTFIFVCLFGIFKNKFLKMTFHFQNLWKMKINIFLDVKCFIQKNIQTDMIFFCIFFDETLTYIF